MGGMFNVGGMFDFTAKGAKERIKQGYDDTIKVFQNIKTSIDREKEIGIMLGDAKVRESQNLKKMRNSMENISKRAQNLVSMIE